MLTINAKAIAAAQEIVDSTVDIHPEHEGKLVVSLSVSPETEALSVTVHFQGGNQTRFTGLWAKEIVKHLHKDNHC